MRGDDEQGPSLGGDRYVLTRRLGEGGMATVFLAWDVKLKVWRAIKVLLPAIVSKRKLRKRFENEAHAMARLEHQNIVRIYDVGLEGSVPYMVMELAEGGCIIDWLDRFGHMPPRLAMQVTDELCQGISGAHEAGIVHRDVKPHNVLVTRNGTCKVTDFGIAQVMDQDALTKTGSVMGTWGFMAPEQRIDAKNVDERADVFGIGATFYNLLCNKQPTELYVADEDDDVFDGIPPELLGVILKACAYKPKARYQSVEELRQALLALVDQQPPLPDDTPSLVLEHRSLPDSIESARFSSTIVDELEEALGQVDTLDGDATNPGIEDHVRTPAPAPQDRVLPYYMPQSKPERAAPVPRPLGDVPTYIDARAQQRAAPPSLSTPIGSEPPPEEQVAEPQGSDTWIHVITVMLLTLVLGMGVIGWGLVSVNGAEKAYLQAYRGLESQMDIEHQGPVIDGLGLAGADKTALERAHQRFVDADPAQGLLAAEAYLALVQRTTQTLGTGPTVDQLRPVIVELDSSYEHTERARDEWAEIAANFPGMLAVSIGLAMTP